MCTLPYRFLAGTAAVAAALTASAAADAIRLKASLRLHAGADVIRLADIADLEGDEARRLADVVIAQRPDSDRALEIPVRQVRAALEAADVHWGRVNLSGSTTVVRPRRRAAAAPLAMTSVDLEGGPSGSRRAPKTPAAPPQDAAPVVSEPSLRGAVARTLVAMLDVPADDVRMLFEEPDRARLDRIDAKARYELTAIDSASSERITFAARMWADGGLTALDPVTVRPLLRVPAATLRQDVGRGAMLQPGDLDLAPRWLTPPAARLACPPEELAGVIAKRSLSAGAVVRRSDVQAPVVIERGDRVRVRCLVGGLVIALQAEARDDGAPGETIELRKLGERTTFVGTVVGPGEAYVDMSR